jgi:ubiquinone/menaquinone biosynthesis C-methylase UbiE
MNVRIGSVGVLVLALSAWSGALGSTSYTQGQRNPEDYAKLLEGAERVAKLQVTRVIEALELTPGMKVADIGSGSGLFTRPIAQAVAPGGTAYAVDIDAGLLEIVARRGREAGIDNIVTVRGDAGDPRLPELVDLAFICDTLHHIQGQAAYLKNLRKHLRPGARVAIIDFSDQWPEGHESMRYSLEQLDGWMAAAGFTRMAVHDWLDNSFFAIYR